MLRSRAEPVTEESLSEKLVKAARGEQSVGTEIVQELVELDELIHIKEKQEEVLESLYKARTTYDDDLNFYRGIAIGGQWRGTLDDPPPYGFRLWGFGAVMMFIGIGIGAVGTWVL